MDIVLRMTLRVALWSALWTHMHTLQPTCMCPKPHTAINMAVATRNRHHVSITNYLWRVDKAGPEKTPSGLVFLWDLEPCVLSLAYWNFLNPKE